MFNNSGSGEASRATHDLINERWHAFITNVVVTLGVDVIQKEDDNDEHFLNVEQFLVAANAGAHRWDSLVAGLDQQLLDRHTVMRAGSVYATHHLLSRSLQSHPTWQLLASNVSDFHQKATLAAQAKAMLTAKLAALGLGWATTTPSMPRQHSPLNDESKTSYHVEEVEDDDNNEVIDHSLMTTTLTRHCWLQQCTSNAAVGTTFCQEHRECKEEGCTKDRLERDARCRLHKSLHRRHRKRCGRAYFTAAIVVEPSLLAVDSPPPFTKTESGIASTLTTTVGAALQPKRKQSEVASTAAVATGAVALRPKRKQSEVARTTTTIAGAANRPKRKRHSPPQRFY